jgi:2,3,4,5-tetrahydropyridine-2-carboxylate N-succinyltransferase
MSLISKSIEALWLKSPEVLESSDKDILAFFLKDLDEGTIRTLEKRASGWHLNTWVKQGILLVLKYSPCQIFSHPTFGYDKIPSKFQGWSEKDFAQARLRLVPGATARRGAYIGPQVVLMQSFVNIGACVEEGAMVDTWALVGSCAYVGKHCHISAGAFIGGVLEPLQAFPVIIEDRCFIGAHSSITEGVCIEQGSVIGSGVHLSASTPIIHRNTKEITYGRIPAYSVVVPGMIEKDGSFFQGAMIVKEVDEQTRQKTSVNSLLRCL